MPDVEGPMDPIDPPSSNKIRPSWLRDTLEDVERQCVKVRSRLGTNGT